ncbi:hypothetical protein OAO87_04470 [bacterium]|nr:hypothetical protein [bacterium]
MAEPASSVTNEGVLAVNRQKEYKTGVLEAQFADEVSAFDPNVSGEHTCANASSINTMDLRRPDTRTEQYLCTKVVYSFGCTPLALCRIYLCGAMAHAAITGSHAHCPIRRRAPSAQREPRRRAARNDTR